MSLAEELFTAMRQVYKQESALYDFIETLELGGDGWQDWSYDDYDTSLEIYVVPPDRRLSEAAKAKALEAGFSIVWLNHVDGWETMYSLHRDAEYRTDRGAPKERGEDYAHKQLRRELAARRGTE